MKYILLILCAALLGGCVTGPDGSKRVDWPTVIWATERGYQDYEAYQNRQAP